MECETVTSLCRRRSGNLRFMMQQLKPQCQRPTSRTCWSCNIYTSIDSDWSGRNEQINLILWPRLAAQGQQAIKLTLMTTRSTKVKAPYFMFNWKKYYNIFCDQVILKTYLYGNIIHITCIKQINKKIMTERRFLLMEVLRQKRQKLWKTFMLKRRNVINFCYE